MSMLQRLAAARAATAAALSGQAVPSLTLAGNSFTCVVEKNKKVVAQIDDAGQLYVDVHIVDIAGSLSKNFYKEKFSQNEDDQVAPTCFSNDGIVPSPQSEERQCDTCAGCPHNVWGSTITELGNKGKRCRDAWKTAVIVPKFSNETPFQLRIPPASLKNWNAYLATFAELQLGDREANPSDVMTRVFFESGKTGIINFAPIEIIEETDARYQHLLYLADKGLTNNLIGVDNSAPALPAPEKQKSLPAPKNVLAAASREVDPETEELMQEVMEAKAEVAELSELEQMRRKLAAMEAQASGEQTKKAPPTTQETIKKPAPTTGQPAVNFKKKAATTPATPPIKGLKEIAGLRTAAKPGGAPLAGDAPKSIMPKANPLAAMTKKKEEPAQQSGTPAGIPSTNLPPELSALLGSIMDG